MEAIRNSSLTCMAVAELRRSATTWCVALIAIAVYFVPGAADLLQYHRQAMAEGQWWRHFTGFVTHWNAEHLFWDVLMFVVLGCMVESQSRWRMIGLCLGSATAISGFTWCARTDVSVCRGLSGIDTALFTYVAVMILLHAVTRRQWTRCFVSGLLLAGFGGKLLFEAVTGSTLFVNSDRAGFVVLIEAHVLGALAGIVLAGIGEAGTWSGSLLGGHGTAAELEAGHRERCELEYQPIVRHAGRGLLSVNAIRLTPRV
jgi:rhomboid family GlyGly-CTERM serine protease